MKLSVIISWCKEKATISQGSQTLAIKPWIAAGGIVILVAAAYANSLHGGFFFDDLTAIQKNPHLRSLWPPGRVLSAPADTTAAGRPLVCLSLAVNYALGGLNPFGYHVFNVGIHMVAALAFFGVIRRTLQLPNWSERLRNRSTAFAFAAASIWALHPLQTESVSYVIQRAESLVGLFYWLTLYGAIRANEKNGEAWAVFSVAACAAGMMSKETMVFAPFVVFLYDRAFLAPNWKAVLGRRPWFYPALFGTWIILGLLVSGRYRTQSVGFGLEGVSAWEYLKTQCGVIVYYLRLIVWPSPLVVDYFWPHPRLLRDWLPAAILLVGLFAASLLAWRRHRWAGLVGIFFFLTLAPTSSVLPIVTEIAAEHRLYLALAAPVVLAVAAVNFLEPITVNDGKPGYLIARHLKLILLVLVLAGCTVLTWSRNADYRSDLAIWTDTVGKQPNNPRALASLAAAYQRRGQSSKALELLDTSLRLQPENHGALFNKGTILSQLGRVREGATYLERAIKVRPRHADSLCNYATALDLLNNVAAARATYERALAIQPDHAESHYGLARLDVAAGNLESAKAQLQDCLRARPDYEPAWQMLKAVRKESPVNQP